jgi:hypothetical protein
MQLVLKIVVTDLLSIYESEDDSIRANRLEKCPRYQDSLREVVLIHGTPYGIKCCRPDRRARFCIHH